MSMSNNSPANPLAAAAARVKRKHKIAAQQECVDHVLACYMYVQHEADTYVTLKPINMKSKFASTSKE